MPVGRYPKFADRRYFFLRGQNGRLQRGNSVRMTEEFARLELDDLGMRR
jgi:hypothetical protein